MRKMNRTSAAKAVRSCITVLLAVVMALPVSALSAAITAAVDPSPAVAEAAAVDLPEPVMELDFEGGFLGEQEKNGLKVMEFGPRLMFEEYKENNSYVKDADGKYIFRWTDTPVIFGTSAADYHYEYGVFGNQPTTYDDPEKGNVFRLDSTIEVEEKVKLEPDNVGTVPVYTGGFDDDGNPLDAEAYEKSIIQEGMTVHSAVQITNPFAGMNLSEDWSKSEDVNEGPTWTKGVTISYWVKVPTVEPTEDDDEDDILNDSVLFTFENIQRDDDADPATLDPDGEKVVYQVDDWIKYEAIQNYDPSNPLYAQGELYELETKDGTKYNVLKDYGPLVRLTQDYPGTADFKIYFRDDENRKTPDLTVTVVENGADVTAKLYELGVNIYDDYKTLDTKEGSKLARGYINGSMQIAASDTFHFIEDNFTQVSKEDENGNAVVTTVKGAKNLNPNLTSTLYNYRDLRYYNLFYFDGDGRVNEEPDEWHYVTCVIQNDWVQFYVDGEEITADDLGYAGVDGEPFQKENAKKYFNKGFGGKWPYHRSWSNVPDFIADGTLSSGPANSVAQTMLEWISQEDTVLYLGNQGCGAQQTGQEIGTLDGVLLDDIKFYDVPLTEEQAVALYEQSKAEMAAANSTTLPAPVKTLNFEDDAFGSIPAGMSEAPANDASKVAVPGVVNEATFGKVLKIHASKSTTTSALKFENPFAGKNLSGATVSYWIKSVGDSKGRVSEGLTVTFLDDPKVLVHNKIQDAVKDVATRTGLWANNSADAMFQAGLDTSVYDSLKNHYQQSTKKNGNTDSSKAGYDAEAASLEEEWNARLKSTAEAWHHVTMVMKNSGIYMYFDGEKLSNNLEDDMGAAFYGPRFYDGYYHKYNDSFSFIRFGTGNALATPLVTFLTQSDTAAYFGYMYRQGSSSTYRATVECYLDDVNFYDVALNDDQVKAAYDLAVADAASKSAVAGVDIDQPDDASGNDTQPTEEPDDGPQGPGAGDDVQVVGGTVNEDGSWTGTANGVTVNLPAGAYPEGAELSLSVAILGTQDSAASYTAANAALKGAGIDVDSQVITLYDIKVLDTNGAEVAITGDASITLTPPSGYTAAKTSIVRMSDVKSMSTSVSGSSLAYKTESLGQFAVMQKKSSGVSGDASKTGTSTAGKTGDAASVAVPFALLAAAFCVIVVIRRKEESLED